MMIGTDALTAQIARTPTRPATIALMRAECEHQTANLLQFVTANLARSARQTQDQSARQAIEQAAEQLTGVGQLLEHQSRPEDVQARLRAICDPLDLLLLRPAGHSLTFRAETDVIGLIVRPSLARCLALIVTGLVINAAKHAFPGRDAGQVTVSLGRTQTDLACTVRDDGAGAVTIAGRVRSQGLVLAERLAAEAGGSCRWLFTDSGTLGEALLPLHLPSSEPHKPQPAMPPALWRKLIRRDTT